jgi:HlyD family secretion protein
MNKKLLLSLVGILLVAGMVWWYFAHNSSRRKAPLKLYGNVDIRQVELAFRVPGKLARVLVDEGDAVKAGQVLASLDATPYRDALAKAKGDRDVALAGMEKYHAGFRSEEIAQAKALVEQMHAQQENAALLASRRQTLLKTGAIAKQDFDDARASSDALAAQLQSARQAFELEHKGYRIEDIQSADASLRSAEASMDMATNDMADTELITPSDGTVLSRVREPGAMAASGTTILVVSLDKPVWVRAYVSEPSLGMVHLGMPLNVSTDSRPDKPYLGKVGFISPVAEFTPKNVETEALRTDLVYRLRIIVEEPDEMLRQGMPVTLTTLPEDKTNAAKVNAK